MGKGSDRSLIYGGRVSSGPHPRPCLEHYKITCEIDDVFRIYGSSFYTYFWCVACVGWSPRELCFHWWVLPPKFSRCPGWNLVESPEQISKKTLNQNFCWFLTNYYKLTQLSAEWGRRREDRRGGGGGCFGGGGSDERGGKWLSRQLYFRIFPQVGFL